MAKRDAKGHFISTAKDNLTTISIKPIDNIENVKENETMMLNPEHSDDEILESEKPLDIASMRPKLHVLDKIDTDLKEIDKPENVESVNIPDTGEYGNNMPDENNETLPEVSEIEAASDELIGNDNEELPNIQTKLRIRIVETTYGDYYKNIYPKLTINRAYQRSKVWEDERKNLFIDSCLQDFFCGMMCIHQGDLLDGSQRSSTYANTIDGVFIPAELTEDFEDLQNKQFSAWPEKNRKQFLNSILVLVYMPDEWDQEKAIEQYFRINNGKPHTTMEINKGKTRDKRQALQDSINHALWKLEVENAQKQKISAFGKLKGEGIEKIYFNLLYLLYGENQDFKEKNMIKWIIAFNPASHVWGDIRKRTIILYNIFQHLLKQGDDGMKAMKYFCKKIHMLSLLAAIDEKTIVENAADNLYKYWEMATKKDKDNKTDKAIVTQYKNLCSEGTNDTEAIKKRLTFIRALIHKA